MAVRVAIAGSTGSIGTQTLDVLAAEPDRYELVGIGAGAALGAALGTAVAVAAALAGLVSPVIGYRLYFLVGSRAAPDADVEARCGAFQAATGSSCFVRMVSL